MATPKDDRSKGALRTRCATVAAALDALCALRSDRRMRGLVSLALVVLGFFARPLGAAEVSPAPATPPATPLDAAELFAVYKVVPSGTPGARELDRPSVRRAAGAVEKVRIAPRPVLTLRDVEKIPFKPEPADDPARPPRERSIHTWLTYSEWGARRRARAEGESMKGELVEVREGKIHAVNKVWGWSIGRTASFYIRGMLHEFADYDARLQAALKAIHEQPIATVREAGAHMLAPGWKLTAAPGEKGLQWQIDGPPRANGEPWTAKGELPMERGTPFLVCWETKCCVLWAASAEALVAVHFDPSGQAIVTSGEREFALRFEDAPASVRREIERAFPPRDGDPATRLGSIEGTVILAGQPAPGVTVQVITTFDADEHDGESFKMKTDPAGRFRFPKVHAPASVQISMEVMKHGGQEFSGPSLCFHAHLKKDQVLPFTLGGDGQPVAGRIVDPANPQRDWSKSQVEFVLVPPCSDTIAALREKKIGHLADGHENFLKTDGGRAYAPGKLALNADGSFRFARIPTAMYWIYVYPDGAGKGTRVKTLSLALLDGGRSDDVRDLGALTLLDHDVDQYR
jgi:hypothetical protein